MSEGLCVEVGGEGGLMWRMRMRMAEKEKGRRGPTSARRADVRCCNQLCYRDVKRSAFRRCMSRIESLETSIVVGGPLT